MFTSALRSTRSHVNNSRLSAQQLLQACCASSSPLARFPFVCQSYSGAKHIMTSASIPDKYRSPPQAPPVFSCTKESIVADAKDVISGQRAVLDKIAASLTPETATFDNVMQAIANDDDQASLKLGILSFYQHVSAISELRGSSSEAEKLLEDFSIESMMREDIFKLVDALYQKRKSLNLSPESLRLLEKTRKQYISNGLGLPAGPQRGRFKEIKTRLSDLAIEFSKNLNEEDGGLWFTPEELKGVPDDVISGLDKGTGENEGKVRLTFKYPHLLPTLKYALNPETRRKVQIANENKVRCRTRRHILSNSTLTTLSATKTDLCSRRQLCSETKLLECWDSTTTLP
jgi:metallopeptidase MepB